MPSAWIPCDRAGRKSGESGLLDLQHRFGLRGVARAAVGQERVVPQFLEYVLPYRVGTEEISDWREVLYERYNPFR